MAHIVQLKGRDKKQIFPRVISDAVITEPEHLTTLSNDLEDIYAGIKNINNEVENLKKSQPSSSTTVSGNIVSIILDKSKWDSTSKKQTVSVSGIVADEDYQIIQIAPSNEDSNNVNAYNNASITAISQNNGSITFAAEIIPTVDITVLVSYMYTDKYKYDSNTVITAVATTGTGSAYIASVPNVESLTNGLQITIIPHTVSTTKDPTLNINDLGAKNIKLRVANNLNEVVSGDSESWLAANKPIVLCYDGTQWITNNIMSVDSISDDIINKIDDNTNRLDQIAEQINPYSQYWWKRRAVASGYSETKQNGSEIVLSDQTALVVYDFLYNGFSWNNYATLQYASSIIIDQSNGAISLNNPSTYKVSSSDIDSLEQSSFYNKFLNKYVTGFYFNSSNESWSNRIFYIPSNAKITHTHGTNDPNYWDDYGFSLSTDGLKLIGSTLTTTSGSWEIVFSDISDAYPKSGTNNGYEWLYCGKISDFVPSLYPMDIKAISITSASWNNKTYTIPIPSKRYLLWDSEIISNSIVGLFGLVDNHSFYGISKDETWIKGNPITPGKIKFSFTDSEINLTYTSSSAPTATISYLPI